MYTIWRLVDCDSTYNEALAGFNELQTLYPTCESVSRAWQESGGGCRTIPHKPEREREREFIMLTSNGKALMWERKDLLQLSVLVHLRKRLHKNNVDVCQIITRFSADCLYSCWKEGVKISVTSGCFSSIYITNVVIAAAEAQCEDTQEKHSWVCLLSDPSLR